MSDQHQGDLPFDEDPEIEDCHFDGDTYDPELDHNRLRSQLGRVYNHLRRGGWYTLGELRAFAQGSEAGVSARVRDLRKEKFGGYDIASRRRGEPKNGLFEYHLEGKAS